MNLEDKLKNLAQSIHLTADSDYKLMSIKWYQKPEIFFKSWYRTICALPYIIEFLKGYKDTK